FTGRTPDIVNIPSKPTPVGFKIWVLAQLGHVLNMLWHVCGDKIDQGPQGLQKKWKEQGFNKTQAIVLELLTRMPNQGSGHIVWLDNLFTSSKLLSTLRDLGIGAAGTVRTEKLFGMDPKFMELKISWTKHIPWGKVYGRLSSNGKVLQLAWKNSQLVLFMTTISNGKQKRWRIWRRPKTPDKWLRTAFGNQPFKKLEIPDFIDLYNHFMNGVDRADQVRSYYRTNRRQYRTWRPLWNFLF
ncbi:hypothetical protein K469DRAFT_537254, partial [Zopfia rhizophila CBS 207.26]